MSNNATNCSGSCDGCSGCGPSPSILHNQIELTLQDDSTVTCDVLTVFSLDDPAYAGKQYIALLPLGENGEAKDDIYLFIFALTENGDPLLSNIEDEAEYEACADTFRDMLRSSSLAAAADPENAEG